MVRGSFARGAVGGWLMHFVWYPQDRFVLRVAGSVRRTVVPVSGVLLPPSFLGFSGIAVVAAPAFTSRGSCVCCRFISKRGRRSVTFGCPIT